MDKTLPTSQVEPFGGMDGDRVLPSKGVSAHMLEDQLLVFFERTQTLYTLNASAAVVWLCCEDGMNQVEIVRSVAETFRISPEAAQDDVHTIIEEWISLGLVARSGAEPEYEAPFGSEDSPLPDEDRSSIASTQRFRCEFHFRLAGLKVLVRMPGPVEEANVRPIFLHLESDEEDCQSVIEVVSRRHGYVVLRDGAEMGECSQPNELGPIISQGVLVAAYRRCDFLIAVHAAVLGTRDGCVVFPGISGIGKTTLAVGLMNAGFRYFTDEVAIVERGSNRIIPVPVGLRVKEGSWKIVSSMLEHFAGVWYTVAQNGTSIRYAVPAPGSFASSPEEGKPVKWLVFPTYSPQGPASLSPLSRIEAIRRLQAVGYEIRDRLNGQKVGELVAWIKHAECCEMTFPSLSSAITMVQGLVE